MKIILQKPYKQYRIKQILCTVCPKQHVLYAIFWNTPQSKCVYTFYIVLCVGE